MPKCVECQYRGKFTQLTSPFPIEMMLGAKLGLPGQTNVMLVGFEEVARKHGFSKNDLVWKAMRCQAPGGGPTQSPIVLVQAVADQPCSYFRAATSSPVTTPYIRIPAASIKQSPPSLPPQNAAKKPLSAKDLTAWGGLNLGLGALFALALLFSEPSESSLLMKEFWTTAGALLICPTPFLVAGGILLAKGIKKRKDGNP